MYLHLGKNVVIRTGDILAILDIETSSVSKITGILLRRRRPGGDHLSERHRAAQILSGLRRGGGRPGVCIPSGALHPAAAHRLFGEPFRPAGELNRYDRPERGVSDREP